MIFKLYLDQESGEEKINKNKTVWQFNRLVYNVNQTKCFFIYCIDLGRVRDGVMSQR